MAFNLSVNRGTFSYLLKTEYVLLRDLSFPFYKLRFTLCDSKTFMKILAPVFEKKNEVLGPLSLADCILTLVDNVWAAFDPFKKR